MKNTIIIIVVILLAFGGYKLVSKPKVGTTASTNVVSNTTSSQNINITGSYVCLPYLVKKVRSSVDCAYGIKTNDGIYYAVNYATKAGYMDQFIEGQNIEAVGYVTPKDKLVPNRWTDFEMTGLFTVTEPTIKK